MTTATPTVHLNGSAFIDLMGTNLTALRALRIAVTALQSAAPNGRDYYVQGNTAYEAARKQHEVRLHRLADNIRELQEIIAAVGDQKKR